MVFLLIQKLKAFSSDFLIWLEIRKIVTLEITIMKVDYLRYGKSSMILAIGVYFG